MFWNFEKNILNRTALIDTNNGTEVTYKELDRDCNRIVQNLKNNKKQLAFLLCENSYSSILSYIALLKSGCAILLLDSKLDSELLNNLIAKYSPELIFSSNQKDISNYSSSIHINGINIHRIKLNQSNSDLYDDLAVLLSTSGTTGSSKLVRLSYANIQSNAESIANYLDITKNDKPITSLPMSYSYGLSVINSHLLKGATIILTNGSIVLRNFWDIFNKYKCTSFAGVPYSYQLLQRTHFEKLDLPTLKTLTQAGGNLSESFQKYFAEYSEKRNIKFFVMYGQTEATARISYVPPEKLNYKFGSIGISIPGGELKLYSENKIISDQEKEGEIVYSGKNVMLGYAEDRNSLNNDDQLNGVLYTGDLGKIDSDGYFYITGRVKRFIKIFGMRLNLDEAERMIENHIKRPVACIGNDDQLNILIKDNNEVLEIEVRKKIKELYKIHNSVIRVNEVKSIPVTPSGKRDYKKMYELIR